jgi:serine/threonine protein kinase
LIDFGLSITGSGKHHELAGTTYYMAPEIFAYNYGTPCDIWALGISLFYMLTGK